MTNEEFIQSIALPGEEWRDVVGWEGLYAVSNLGRVASLRTRIPFCGRSRACEQRVFTPKPSNCNGILYYRIRFQDKNKGKLMSVHRVVAEAFIPNPNNYPCIDHIDRNGLNNNVNNLRWASHKMNSRNVNSLKVMSDSHKGQDNSRFFHPVCQMKNGKLIRSYSAVKGVKQYGFNPKAVANVLCGRSKSSGGYCWMYLSDYESQVSMSKNSNADL